MSEYLVDQDLAVLPQSLPDKLASKLQSHGNGDHPELVEDGGPSGLVGWKQLLQATIQLADDIAARPNRGSVALPREDLSQLAALGLLCAPLPAECGGLGSSPEGHLLMLRLLSIVGGADLVLGRLFEGHVNAVLLISTFGTRSQLLRAVQDCRAGLWFGVWNTGHAEPLRLDPGRLNGTPSFIYQGAKTFASGAGFIQRPIVTAQLQGVGWQMTMPRMEISEVASAVTIDRSFWNPLGMASSESLGVDFSGARIGEDDLIGTPGDFYRDPIFYGGAIRFAAAQTGALLRLHRLFAQRLESSGNNDPYQVARLGEIAIGAQEAVLWIERAAAVAAECYSLSASKLEIERMHETADMTRLAIERIATAMLSRIVAGVGAHGLLQPSPFERIVRDLTMYLRQPIPDQTIAAVGRTSMRKSSLRAHGASSGFWNDKTRDDSVPPAYFDRLYQRASDPWQLESSEYETDKYQQTIAALTRERYVTALEIGCSIGVLTAQLATRIDWLLSVDVSEQALDAARKRCALAPNICFARMRIPNEEPSGLFDLIVVSEVAYYWQCEDLDCAIAMILAHQTIGSHLLLVHHTKPVPDYPLTGDQVHDAWLARPEWRMLLQQRHDGYRLDLLERCS